MREIKKLKSEIKQLRKLLTRVDVVGNKELLMNEEFSVVNKQSKNYCPKCSSNLQIIQGTKIKVFVCSECNYRCSTSISK